MERFESLDLPGLIELMERLGLPVGGVETLSQARTVLLNDAL